MSRRTTVILMAGLVAAGLLLIAGRAAHADSRTDYLIDLIKESGNFRVRVQSAKTLGDIGSSAKGDEKKKIIDALVKACGDKNELVRMTAAAALGTVGDSAGIPALEKLKNDKVKEVKDQAKESIKKIKAIQESLGKSSTTTPEEQPGTEETPPPVSDVDPAYYVGLGSWSDKSGFEKYDAKGFVKKKLTTLLAGIPGVKVKPDGEAKTKTEQVLKKEKLTGYTLTGSIGEVALGGGNSASASISIVVLDKEGNVQMLNGKGSAALEGSKKSSKDNEKDLVLSALNTAVQGAVEPFSDHLQKNLKSVSQDGDKGKDKGKKGKKKKKKKGT
jgi:hypothetical protein